MFSQTENLFDFRLFPCDSHARVQIMSLNIWEGVSCLDSSWQCQRFFQVREQIP
jgi:hypothetical protein